MVIETLENEMQKLEKTAMEIDKNNEKSFATTALKSSKIIQSVKLVVTLMGTLETPDITDALDSLEKTCSRFMPNAEVRNSLNSFSVYSNNFFFIVATKRLGNRFSFRIDQQELPKNSSLDS